MTQEMNPYRPPVAEVDLASDAAQGRQLAGKWRRFFTWVLDYVGFVVLSMIVGLVLGLVLRNRVHAVFEGGWRYVYSFAVMISYYVFFEGLWGRTPAKMMLGTTVIDMRGRPPTLGAVFKRTPARFVPFEGLTFLGERGFHDKISGTRVVRTR